MGTRVLLAPLPRAAPVGYSSDPAGDEWSVIQGNLPLWIFSTGGSVRSSPAVEGECVYVGSNDSNVYCLSATTGALIWTYTTGNCVESSPAVANGSMFVGSDDGKVYCLNATTGALTWTFTTGNSVESSPAVANGSVFVGSDDGNVYCLNATTGALKWTYTTGNRVESSPAVANGSVFVGSDDGNVYGLDATTGTKLWNYTIWRLFPMVTIVSVSSAPTAANGSVFVVSDGGTFYSLNATTGAPLWQSSADHYYYGDYCAQINPPTFANDCIYYACHWLLGVKFFYYVFCLNASTGEEVWNYNLNAPRNAYGPRVEPTPAVANGLLYIGIGGEELYVINASTGEIMWDAVLGGGFTSSPILANGFIYLGSDDSNLYCLPMIMTPPAAAPLNPQVFLCNGLVTFSWQPPEGAGGGPITGYRIYPAFGSIGINQFIRRPITVDNVISTTYDFGFTVDHIAFYITSVSGICESPLHSSVVNTWIEDNPICTLLSWIAVGISIVAVIVVIKLAGFARRRITIRDLRRRKALKEDIF